MCICVYPFSNFSLVQFFVSAPVYSLKGVNIVACFFMLGLLLGKCQEKPSTLIEYKGVTLICKLFFGKLHLMNIHDLQWFTVLLCENVFVT